MKKISTYLASALLMLMVLSSCSSRPEDINASKPEEIDVADLYEPCDYVDAAEQVVDAIIEITEDAKSPDLLTEDDKKHIQTLSRKLVEIGNKYGEKFDIRGEPNCPNTEELIKKRRKVNRGEFREIILSAGKQENSNASKPLEAKAADLSEPCDVVDAMQDIAEAAFNIMKSVNGDPSKLTDDDKKRGEALEKKMGELMRAAGEKKINITDCENYKAYVEKMEELQEKMRKLR